MKVFAIICLALLLTACGGGDYKNPANINPRAHITSSVTAGFSPLLVSFNAQNSSDEDGYVTGYSWDFGDGTTATTMTADHVFTTPTSGSGSFSPAITVSADANDSTSATVGDVDGNGDPDLVIGNLTVNRLYINDGAGNFTGSDITTDSAYTTSVALGDVDNDNDLDLIVGNRGTTNRVYKNDGSGNFPSGSDISTDTLLTTAIALGDINGDSYIDLVTAEANRPNRLYLNDTTGNFLAASDIAADADNTASIALADVNNDTFPDVIVGNDITSHYGTISNVTNTSPIVVTSAGHGLSTGQEVHIEYTGHSIDNASYTVTVIDNNTFSLDGTTATTFKNGVITYVRNTIPLSVTSNGHGLFTGGSVSVSNIGYGVNNGVYKTTVLDANSFTLEGTSAVNKSGSIVSVANTTPIEISSSAHGLKTGSKVSISGSTLSAINGNEYSITVVDANTFSLDGTTASGTSSGGGTWALTGWPTTTARWIHPGGAWSYSTTITKVYLNNTIGGFDPAIPIDDTGVRPTRALAPGDFDGDGNIDLVTGNTGDNRLYLGNGTGSFGPGSDIAGGNEPTYALSVIDIDGDSDLDLVVGNYLKQPNRILINDGTGSFNETDTLPVEPGNTRAIATADIDGDNDVDIITANDGYNLLDPADGKNYVQINGSGYLVSLTVTDDEGGKDTTTEFISVSDN